jgi:hypothetical protein
MIRNTRTQVPALAEQKRRKRYRMHRSAKSYALGREAIHPSPMTADERLDEIAEILAAGILRVRRKLRGEHLRDRVRLDFSPDRSMHADRSRRRKSR